MNAFTRFSDRGSIVTLYKRSAPLREKFMRSTLIAILILGVSVAACGGPSTAIGSAVPTQFQSSSTLHQVSSMLSSGNISQIALPPFFDAGPIVEGPDKNVWIGETENTSGPGRIARITPSGTMTVFNVGGAGGPSGLGSAVGALWFSSARGIGKMDTSGHFRIFPIPSGMCVGRSIVQGPDHNVWFTDPCSNSIARVTPAGHVDKFAVPSSYQPQFITTAPDGNLWFSVHTPNMVAKTDTSGHITFVPIRQAFVPREIIDGHDGFLYLVDSYLGNVVRIALDGSSTNYSFGADFSRAQDVGFALGPDHQMWMVSTSGKLMKFNPRTGTFSNAIDLPAGQGKPPVGEKGIVTGSDKDMWFTSGDVGGSADYVGVYEL